VNHQVLNSIMKILIVGLKSHQAKELVRLLLGSLLWRQPTFRTNTFQRETTRVLEQPEFLLMCPRRSILTSPQ